MKREPSIHITQTNLRNLIREFHDYDDNADDHIEDLVEFLLKRGKPFSLEKRTITPNSKTSKKIETKVSNDKTDYQLLSTIIYSIRKQLRHKGIKSIDMNSAEYSQLKKLSKTINTFAEDFQKEKRQAYIEYVTLGLKKINSFRGYLAKLNDMSESIAVEYEASQVILDDDYKNKTKIIHDQYVDIIFKKTGILENYQDRPINYINFIKVRELADKYKLKYDVFLKAQFEGLEWTGGYPDPSQLISEKAIERLNKFLFKNKSNVTNETPEVNKSLSNVLKKIKDGNYNNA